MVSCGRHIVDLFAKGVSLHKAKKTYKKIPATRFEDKGLGGGGTLGRVLMKSPRMDKMEFVWLLIRLIGI